MDKQQAKAEARRLGDIAYGYEKEALRLSSAAAAIDRAGGDSTEAWAAYNTNRDTWRAATDAFCEHVRATGCYRSEAA